MARKIIIKERIVKPTYFEVNAVFWLVVPTGRQPFLANANATSAAPSVTTEELNAIKTGAIREEIFTFSFPVGTPIGTIGATILSKYNTRQTEFNNDTTYTFYSSFHNGTSWTMQGE